MKFSVSVFLSVFASMVLAADPLVIETPTLIQCDRSVVSWSGGHPSTWYGLRDLIPQILVDLAHAYWRSTSNFLDFDGVQEVRHNLNDHSEIWMTNLPSGTVMQFEVQDATGATADTAETIVQPSNQSGCL
ncbi:hypothetical protein C8Q78DRAFT_1074531 [Trametes maxima]|nr:hypothetical protein C8Q78DRAFT_1074531 [Trametes maxima]